MQYPQRISSFLAVGVALAALGTMTVPRAQGQATGPANLALNKPALASAIENEDFATYNAGRAVDGDMSTRWAAGAAGEQWWAVDLGSVQDVGQVRLNWEAAYAAGYEIRTSNDALPEDPFEVDITGFTSVHTTTAGNGAQDVIPLNNVRARTVAVVANTPGPFETYSLFEVQVFAERGAAISGKVMRTSSAPIQGATVRIVGPDTQTMTTDAQGNYSFTSLLPGSYTLTVYQSGQFAPLTYTIPVENNAAEIFNVILETPVTLTPFTFPFLNADWVSTEENPEQYSNNFDFAFPADELPANPVTANGVTFRLGSTAGTEANTVSLIGAGFAVPQGRYTALHTLASSTAGPYNANVTLTYADGSTQVVPFTVSDWFANPTANEQEGIVVHRRLNADGAANEGANIRIFQGRIPVDGSKDLVSFAFSNPQSGSPPNVQAYAFGITLESLNALPALGTLSGTVNGPNGALANATVNVGPYTVTTDAQGQFTVPNLPAGNYTVTAFQAGQFAPVSQTATLAAGGAQKVTITLSNRPQFVQYPLPYTHDWISSHENPGDFFAGDFAFPAEEMPTPGAQTLNGIQFLIPSMQDNTTNALWVNGQTLPVPPARYSALYLLESSGWGGWSAPITLTYTDGSTEQVTASFTDWFGNATPSEREAIVVTHRHSPAEPDASAGSRIKIFSQTLPVNASKTLRSITLPPHQGEGGNYTSRLGMIFAMTLEALEAPQTGTVTGTIRGAAGPVANATVSLGGFGSVTTNAQGVFTISNAPVGTFNLQVTPAGGSNLAGATQSVTVTAGQTATADVPQLAAGPTQVFSRLGSSNFEGGLRQLQSATVTNSATTAVTEAGQGARHLPENGRMYFDVDNSFLFNNTGSDTVYVQVEYLDRGTDAFALRYNSNDPTLSNYDPRYARVAEVITKTNSGQYQTYVFELTDAGFYGALEMGADFFIEAQAGAEVIRSVVVSKTGTFQPLPNPPARMRGDINNDTRVDVRDATMALQAAVGLRTLTPEETAAGDVIPNNTVDLADVTRILRVAVGLDTL